MPKQTTKSVHQLLLGVWGVLFLEAACLTPTGIVSVLASAEKGSEAMGTMGRDWRTGCGNGEIKPGNSLNHTQKLIGLVNFRFSNLYEQIHKPPGSFFISSSSLNKTHPYLLLKQGRRSKQIMIHEIVTAVT